MKVRGSGAPGESDSDARPAERGFSHEYWPFSGQCMPVRQPEALRTRSGNSFGSPRGTQIRTLERRIRLRRFLQGVNQRGNSNRRWWQGTWPAGLEILKWSTDLENHTSCAFEMMFPDGDSLLSASSCGQLTQSGCWMSKCTRDVQTRRNGPKPVCLDWFPFEADG